MRKVSLLALSALFATALVGCGGGGGDDDPSMPAPAPPPAPAPAPTPPPPSGPASANIDRTESKWNVTRSTSSIDGTKTTRLRAFGTASTFNIYCTSKGEKGYYVSTEFVTGSDYFQYRIGHNPVETQSWREATAAEGFQFLTAPSFDINLLKQLYQNWDFTTRQSRFGSGIVTLSYTTSGFGAAIDQTREDCGWSTDMFPPNNGWGSDYPDAPPENAVKPTYTGEPANRFGFVAWKATNSSGKPQLLVRVGVDKALCKGTFVIDDRRLYVVQDGKRVSAVSGTDFRLSCETDLPATFALSGDFDASRPLTLQAYPFHFNTLEPGTPFAAVDLN